MHFLGGKRPWAWTNNAAPLVFDRTLGKYCNYTGYNGYIGAMGRQQSPTTLLKGNLIGCCNLQCGSHPQDDNLLLCLLAQLCLPVPSNTVCVLSLSFVPKKSQSDWCLTVCQAWNLPCLAASMRRYCLGKEKKSQSHGI